MAYSSMDLKNCIFLAAGFLLVFIGAAYHKTINKRTNGADVTDFQSFLFGTGFTYFTLVAWITVTFFCDYFISGSALQGYNTTPEKNTLFFAVFGNGLAGEGQYPLMYLDLAILSCMVGCALGGAALLIVFAVRGRRKNTPQNGLFYGYTFPKTTVKDYFKNELAVLKSQIHPIEYLVWWSLRLVMAYVVIKRYVTQGYDTVVLQLTVNLIATFIIPLARVLFFGKLFFGNIHYRVQSYIDILIFAGSLLGQGFSFVGEVEEYDKFMHLVSGGVAVFIAFRLIEGTRGGRKLSKYSKAAASAGFSCTVMAAWELFEFFADYYMPESYNQNWIYNPPADMFFFRIFGFGAQNPNQVALLDTDLDIFIAVIGCSLCTGALLVLLTVREKNEQKNRAPGRSMAKAFSYNEII